MPCLTLALTGICAQDATKHATMPHPIAPMDELSWGADRSERPLIWQYGGGVHIDSGTATFQSCQIYSNTVMCVLQDTTKHSTMPHPIAPMDEPSDMSCSTLALTGNGARDATKHATLPHPIAPMGCSLH